MHSMAVDPLSRQSSLEPKQGQQQQPVSFGMHVHAGPTPVEKGMSNNCCEEEEAQHQQPTRTLSLQSLAAHTALHHALSLPSRPPFDFEGSLKQEQPHTNSSDAATELTVPETVPESCAPLDESNPIIGAYMDLMRDDDSMDWLSAVELQERCNEGQALNPEPCVGKPIASAEGSAILGIPVSHNFEGDARTSCSGALSGQQQLQGQGQQQLDADLLSWLEDPAITEAARASQAVREGGDNEFTPPFNSGAEQEASASATAAAAAAAQIAAALPPDPQQQLFSSMMQSSSLPFPGFPLPPPFDGSASTGDGSSFLQSMLPGMSLGLGFGGQPPMMGLPGIPGVFGQQGMGGMMPGSVIAPGLPGLMPPGFGSLPGVSNAGGAGGGSSGRGSSSKSSGTGKRQRENLPKASVVTLKTWMLNHIQHPYPTEAQKNALMQATGLDLLQLNNWFINARVRIWRPIIVNVYQQQYDRLMAVAQAQGDEHSVCKLREALSNPPAALAIIQSDTHSTACLHTEAQQATLELHQQQQQGGSSRGSGSRGRR